MLRISFLLLLLVCLPAPGDEEASRWLDSADCKSQCRVIRRCASKAKHPELGRTLCHLAACESGKLCAKKKVRSSNGLYHGPFQFGLATWKSLCRPFFRRSGLNACTKKKAIYDPCCASMCAAELISRNLNGGIRNWPHCGPLAKRSVAAEGEVAED